MKIRENNLLNIVNGKYIFGLKMLLKYFFRVDEVICPSPWFLTEKFLEDNKIDYVAHDDMPYVSAGVDDVYAFCKKLGKFKVVILNSVFKSKCRLLKEQKVFRPQI